MRCLSLLFAAHLLSLATYSPALAQTFYLADLKTTFERSPRLIEGVTTFNEVRVWGAKYYFTVELPENAGKPLGKIEIQQREGSDDIDFYSDRTAAFVGTHTEKGEEIPIESTTWDDGDRTISIIFARPIEPGTTVTVGLYPKRNPDYGGVYLFGVTVFPAGDNPQSLYLGVGRLQFYDNRDRHFF